MVLLPRGQIFYDADCEKCQRNYARFGAMTERRGFSWAPIQDDRVREFLGLENSSDRPPELKLLTRKGRLLGGWQAIAFVCKYVWWARPLWVLSRVPVVRSVLSAIFRWAVAHHDAPVETRESDPRHPPVSRAA